MAASRTAGLLSPSRSTAACSSFCVEPAATSDPAVSSIAARNEAITVPRDAFINQYRSLLIFSRPIQIASIVRGDVPRWVPARCSAGSLRLQRELRLAQNALLPAYPGLPYWLA